MLTGESVLTAGEGDLIVVPPGTVHAFAAARGIGAGRRILRTEPAGQRRRLPAATIAAEPAPCSTRPASMTASDAREECGRTIIGLTEKLLLK
jgi:hypothetical protein